MSWRTTGAVSERTRLFALPYAGGAAAAFRGWAEGLGDDIELRPLELPGRGTRFRDPLAGSMEEVVQDLLPEIAQVAGHAPYAFFGHSMGALVAVALISELTSLGCPPPSLLVVSGARRPGDRDERPLGGLPEDAFRRAIHRLNGIPAEVAVHPELMDLMMPIVRADILVLEGWSGTTTGLDDVPIVAIGGLDDPLVTPQKLHEWSALSSAGLTVHVLPGDHFFLHSARAEVLELVGDELRRARGAVRANEV